MAGSQGNGPIGTDPNAAAPKTPGPTGVNDASDPSVKAPVGDTPGPAGKNDQAQVGADKAAAAIDPAIEALDLTATAKAAAYTLKGKFPDVVFTSGRRDKAGQASA